MHHPKPTSLPPTRPTSKLPPPHQPFPAEGHTFAHPITRRRWKGTPPPAPTPITGGRARLRPPQHPSPVDGHAFRRATNLPTPSPLLSGLPHSPTVREVNEGPASKAGSLTSSSLSMVIEVSDNGVYQARSRVDECIGLLSSVENGQTGYFRDADLSLSYPRCPVPAVVRHLNPSVATRKKPP